MSELFFQEANSVNSQSQPLAARVRPKTLDEVVGQTHLIGENAPLRKFFEKKEFPSMVFWGPPGVGKTTFAYLIAEVSDYQFHRISAVEAGVKEVRQIIEFATKLKKSGKNTLLFIDEIHRFNKSQQDALLHAVEKGIITLIGATTENPSFEVNSALLSRCQVYRLQLLSEDDLLKLIDFVLTKDEILSQHKTVIEDKDFLLNISSGDARTLLNAIELAFKYSEGNEPIVINRPLLEKVLQQKTAHYDKKGESHYDTISAFIKSLRGSDPDAAIIWLAKMLDAGEDPKFIARRMVIFASEDIGNADAYAVTLAVTTFKAVEIIGLPEARINLAQCVTYLASCPKSNSAYIAISKAEEDLLKGASLSVPLHLRNAPTKLMKSEGYGKNYKYPHDFEQNFIKENYFPEDFQPKAYYLPSNFGKEKDFKERLKRFWGERYKD